MSKVVGPGATLCQDVSELPRLGPTKRLYLDFETSSGSPKLKSTNPWWNCEPCGYAFTADDLPGAWYVPWALPGAREYCADAVTGTAEWCNQNVKYDVQVLLNQGLELPGSVALWCTLTQAKIIDSDRGFGRGTYELDSLALDWLKRDMGPAAHQMLSWLSAANTRDYGEVPLDYIAPYGCEDVLATRELRAYIAQRMPAECAGVSATESLLTRVLVDVERRGLRVDKTELKKTELVLMHRMLKAEEEVAAACGFPVRPHVNGDCYELLCSHWGLPVLGVTNKGEPSFDHDALVAYLASPAVVIDPEKKRIIELLLKYRELHTLNSLFVTAWQDLAVEDALGHWYLHPTFNQAVRTGRMSAKQPNAQQLSEAAKKLVYPRPGYVFVSVDFSQVEFRLIVHVIGNDGCITAYRLDPRTDFHQWVATMCGIPRKPAKNVNFAIGYGAGKRKILGMLAGEESLVRDLMADAGGNAELFRQLAHARALAVYEGYHAKLPELRATAIAAERVARDRGYVKNLYGRRRHLGPKVAHRAFNSWTQSSAADMMKERMVATSHRHWEWARANDVHQVVSVHDEFVFEVPEELAVQPGTVTRIAAEVEAVRPPVPLRVPIKVDAGVSKRSWAEAGSKEARVPLP